MINSGEQTAFRFFLGVDISKEEFDACCIGSDGGKLFGVSAPMNGDGFDELLIQLSSITGPRESVLIGMESTACYHINLFSFLTSQGFTVIIINPLLHIQLRKA